MLSRQQRYPLTLIFLLGVSTQIQAESPHLYIVLDTSGSMRNNMAWVAEEILHIQDYLFELQANGQELQMSLVGYTDDSEYLAQGNALAVAATIEKIRVNGGIEDGLVPINRLLQEPSLDANSYVVLITDEDRDLVQHITVESIEEMLKRKKIALHLVDTRTRECQDIQNRGNVPTNFLQACMKAARFNGDNKLKDDYLKLVAASGGQYWPFGGTKENKHLFAESLARELYDKYFTQITVEFELSADRYRGQPIYFDASRYSHKLLPHQVVNWEWDFNNDGIADDYGPFSSYVYNQPGEYAVTLTVKDDQELPVVEKKSIMLTVQ